MSRFTSNGGRQAPTVQVFQIKVTRPGGTSTIEAVEAFDIYEAKTITATRLGVSYDDVVCVAIGAV